MTLTEYANLTYNQLCDEDEGIEMSNSQRLRSLFINRSEADWVAILEDRLGQSTPEKEGEK